LRDRPDYIDNYKKLQYFQKEGSMSGNFSRWIRSKVGLASIAGLIIVLLLVGIIGQQLEWWDLNLSGAAGTAITLPPVQYPDPKNGYTCLPTCPKDDGKFLVISNLGQASFAGEKVVLWIGVPGNKTSFELGIFDGDSGKDSTGQVNIWNGNWDDGSTEATYTLYADPLKNGKGTTAIKTWRGNTDNLPNNDWFNQTITNVDAAKAPSRHYFYRLEVTQLAVGGGSNAFKLRSNGYLVTGRADLVNSSVGFVGQLATTKDIPILYPQFKDWNNIGASTYNGEWKFYAYVPKDSKSLTFWDGDFDRGTNDKDPLADSNDPDSPAKPAWAGPFTVNQGRGGSGNPTDDSWWNVTRRSPATMYNLIDPANTPIYKNENPSGTEEWEQFVLSTDKGIPADLYVDQIKPGFYMLQVLGLDMHNFAWLRTDKEICDPVNGCGPCVWPGCNATASCPRTIGYWKNNVKKVYIDNRTNGVQESKETMDWALKAIAMQSPIYRNGLVASLTANATTVKAITTVAPLTPQEANTILQKTTVLGNSMLGRALQQNLATWFNLASGKISDNSIVTINVPSGTFEGTMMEALLEAQNIMLNGGNTERAKDIADMINNGKINIDPDSNVDASGNVICTSFTTVMPPAKQPKKYDELPKAKKPDDLPNPPPEPQPDPNTCAGVRVNKYTVENTTNNPFYAIKFNYASGTEVKNSNFDEFKYTLTKAQAAAMTSIQLEAKAGQDVGTATLNNCQFAEGLICGPVKSSNQLFGFTFMGATNNGNDTMTLTFQVQVYSQFGLSHAAFGLPAGVVPSSPTGNYESKVCP
jgi:hypothetical protein